MGNPFKSILSAHPAEGWTGRIMYLAVVFGILAGIAGGVGLYTFGYARGASYLTSDPTACANCHVMRGHYDAWAKSSHKAVAVCNDCHTPHEFFGKWLIKGINGFNHSMAFTTGQFHEPIQINRMNRAVTESACRYCHREIVLAIEQLQEGRMTMDCARCHYSVGHLK